MAGEAKTWRAKPVGSAQRPPRSGGGLPMRSAQIRPMSRGWQAGNTLSMAEGDRPY